MFGIEISRGAPSRSAIPNAIILKIIFSAIFAYLLFGLVRTVYAVFSAKQNTTSFRENGAI